MLPSSSRTKRGVLIILFALISALIISIVILASVPPVGRDAITHHLAVPKLYLNHGGIYEIPYLKFSYYPMNLDLLYMIPLYFGNDIVPKYIHFSFGLLTAWLIFSYLRHRLNRRYALLGVLFFLSIPIVVKLSITAYVDLGLIFFSFAALIYILKWIENCFNPKYLIVSAVCCGLALGTKYNGLIIFFLCLLFIPFLYSRLAPENGSRTRTALKSTAIFLVTALIISSPWTIRNTIWKKNPVYPLYNDVFRQTSPTAEVSKNKPHEARPVKHLGQFSIRRMIYKEKWWETALIPVRVFFQGKDDDPKKFDGKLNPFLLVLPFFLLLRPKPNPGMIPDYEIKIWLAFSVLLLCYVFVSTDMRIRYISPIIPPLVILSVLGVHRMLTAASDHPSLLIKKMSTGLAVLLVLASIGLNTIYIINLFKHIQPLSFISGRVDRDAYIEKFLPEYPAIQFGNKYLPEDARVLGIFLGNRRYYSEREMLFGINIFKKIIDNATVSEDIMTDLRKKRITHMIIGHSLFGWWVGNNFNQNKKDTLTRFVKNHLRPLFSKNDYAVYRLVDSPE